MRISKRSNPRLSALLALLVATAAIGQDTAGDHIRDAGDAAMTRLKAAVAKTQAKRGALIAPSLPPPPAQSIRRRASDALRSRAPVPTINARARAALVAGITNMAAEREAQATRLRQALGLEPAETEALAKAAVPPAPHAWVPVLFVSSSMPLPVLRTYAAQLERVRGIIALRGMPGGLHTVTPMARLAANILRVDPGCTGPACAMRPVQLIVDPILFRQHGVSRVPALAMIPGDPTRAYCERDADSPRARHLVYGDSALAGLVDEYARLGGGEEVRDVQALLAAR